jgi:hypothetical protein
LLPVPTRHPDPVRQNTIIVSADVSQQIAPAHACDIVPATPAAVPVRALAPQILPVLVDHNQAVAEPISRPASASSFCLSRDGSSVPASAFSRHASVATKPSNESFAVGRPRLVDTLDLQVDIKSGPTIISHHERSVGTLR